MEPQSFVEQIETVLQCGYKDLVVIEYLVDNNRYEKQYFLIRPDKVIWHIPEPNNDPEYALQAADFITNATKCFAMNRIKSWMPAKAFLVAIKKG